MKVQSLLSLYITINVFRQHAVLWHCVREGHSSFARSSPRIHHSSDRNFQSFAACFFLASASPPALLTVPPRWLSVRQTSHLPGLVAEMQQLVKRLVCHQSGLNWRPRPCRLSTLDPPSSALQSLTAHTALRYLHRSTQSQEYDPRRWRTAVKSWF